MNFLTLICSGAGIEYVVRKYARAFLQAVLADPHHWCTKLSHHFVRQCFNALGLNFNVSVEAFQHMHSFPYRNDNLNYIFDAIPFVLHGVEAFLYQLPTVLANYAANLAQEKYSSHLEKHFYQMTQPVPCYIRMVSIWCEVIMLDTMDPDTWTVDKFLREPLARMSFYILNGLTKLLPKYSVKFPDLKDLCLTLTIAVRYGMFYEETRKLLLKPMLSIFRSHFELFCNEQHSALNFVYSVFVCVMPNRHSHIVVYDFLQKTLTEFAHGEQRDANGNLYLRFLTNRLITDNFLAIQFGSLKEHNPKSLVLATLNYLLTLQRYVVSTECFSRRFLEQILVLVMRLPQAYLCALAAQLYITLAQRQFEEQEIVVDILETFVKAQHEKHTNCNEFEQFRALLMKYLSALLPHFPPLRHFTYYTFLLDSAALEVRVELSLLAAQSMCVLYAMHTDNYGKDVQAQQQVHQLLDQWPRLIEASLEPNIRAVLYSIYDAVDFAAVAEHSDQNIMLLLTLERFCLHSFLHDDSLTEAEFHTLYASIARSVDVTGNEQVHAMAAKTLHEEFAHIKHALGGETAPPSAELLRRYCHLVRRLNGLLKCNRLPGRQVRDMYEALASDLLTSPLGNRRLEIYGYETLAYMLASNSAQARDEAEAAKVVRLAQKLSQVCVRELSTPRQVAQSQLQRTKALFCAIVLLRLGARCLLPLAKNTYDLLLKILMQTSTTSYYGTLAASHVREMFHCFRLLHACEAITLPSNRIWKLLLQYKMKATADYVSSELEQLIGVMIEQRLVIYKSCLPVVILHICNECTHKKLMLATLAAHVELIDAHASVKDAWLLRLQIFITTLDLIAKNVDVRRHIYVKHKRSRLLPLQFLMPLVTQLKLDVANFQDIALFLYSLKQKVLYANERRDLEVFIDQISAHKIRCEDEFDAAAHDEFFVGQLQPLPPGPMPIWLLKATDWPVLDNDEQQQAAEPANSNNCAVSASDVALDTTPTS